jgi:class 3 adenylate cyclase
LKWYDKLREGTAMPSIDTTPVPSNTPSYRRFSEQAGEGERRHATVLFADLAGFTAFAERSGEEAAYALMRHISLLMTNAVHEHGGIVTSFTGDGVMALFGIALCPPGGVLVSEAAYRLVQGMVGDRIAHVSLQAHGRQGGR